jgi:hypothetical protein
MANGAIIIEISSKKPLVDPDASETEGTSCSKKNINSFIKILQSG